MAKKENWKHTNVLIQPDVYKEFRMLAVKKDTTVSSLMNELAKEAVENDKLKM